MWARLNQQWTPISSGYSHHLARLPLHLQGGSCQSTLQTWLDDAILEGVSSRGGAIRIVQEVEVPTEGKNEYWHYDSPMAPPLNPFPLTSLPTEVYHTSSNLRPKARKLPNEFNITKDCELYELIQYSCTPIEETYEKAGQGAEGTSQQSMECWPFRRLFRRCVDLRGNMFHVETTAWEGDLKWKDLDKKMSKKSAERMGGQQKMENEFARYGSYFWSGKAETT